MSGTEKKARIPLDVSSPASAMPLRAVLFAVMLTVIFGGNAVAIKLTLTGLGPFTTAGLRFLLAAMAISCWAFYTGRPFRIRAGQTVPLLVISFGFTLQFCLFYLGLERTYASRGALLSNLLPFFVLFLSHRFIPEERITMGKLAGIVLGFGGVATLFAGGRVYTGSVHVGDGLILVAVCVWSCNVVFTKRVIADFHPFQMVFYPMVFSAPLFLGAGALWDEACFFNLSPVVIGAFVYQSLVSAAFGFVAWSTLLKRYGASTLHAFVFIMPIAGVGLSGLVLHEPMTPNLIFAMTLIAMGILLVHLSPKWTAVDPPFGQAG